MKVRTFKAKYSNKRCQCSQGHWHQSIFEADYCNQLHILKLANEIKRYEIQVKFSLKIADHHITNHYVDFLITKNDGTLEVHETKGFATSDWNLKRKMFEAQYPDIPYIVIKKERKRYGRSYKRKRNIGKTYR